MHALVTNEPLRQRLANAYSRFHTVQEGRDLDGELWELHDAIHHDLTYRTDGPGQGTLWKTLNQMTTEQAEALAQRIVELNHLIRNAVAER